MYEEQCSTDAGTDLSLPPPTLESNRTDPSRGQTSLCVQLNWWVDHKRPELGSWAFFNLPNIRSLWYQIISVSRRYILSHGDVGKKGLNVAPGAMSFRNFANLNIVPQTFARPLRSSVFDFHAVPMIVVLFCYGFILFTCHRAFWLMCMISFSLLPPTIQVHCLILWKDLVAADIQYIHLWNVFFCPISWLCFFTFVTFKRFISSEQICQWTKITWGNNDFIYWGKEAVQNHTTLCDRSISPLNRITGSCHTWQATAVMCLSGSESFVTVEEFDLLFHIGPGRFASFFSP